MDSRCSCPWMASTWTIPRWSRRVDRGLELAIGSAIPVPPGVPLVFTEGNYLLHDDDGWDAVRRELDEVWFIDVAPEERRRRLVGRRMEHGESRSEAEAWVDGVDMANASLVERGRDRASLVVQLDNRMPGDSRPTPERKGR